MIFLWGVNPSVNFRQTQTIIGKLFESLVSFTRHVVCLRWTGYVGFRLVTAFRGWQLLVCSRRGCWANRLNWRNCQNPEILEMDIQPSNPHFIYLSYWKHVRGWFILFEFCEKWKEKILFRGSILNFQACNRFIFSTFKEVCPVSNLISTINQKICLHIYKHLNGKFWSQ